MSEPDRGDQMRALPLLVLLALPLSVSAQVRPFEADPWYAYLLDGRVSLADGSPAAGVVVERMDAASGSAPYGAGVFRTTTDATGRFRFEASGLGFTPGHTWHLWIHQPACSGTRVTVTLARGDLPGGGEGDVARGLVVRLPACP